VKTPHEIAHEEGFLVAEEPEPYGANGCEYYGPHEGGWVHCEGCEAVQAVARAGMIEALRWVIEGERGLYAVANKLAELEKS
jgi:hypothetical protein